MMSLHLQTIVHGHLRGKPLCQSDGTIQKYSDIFELQSCGVSTIVKTEVLKKLGEKRARDVGLKWKRGVTQGNPLPRYLDMLDTVSTRQHFVGYIAKNPP